MNKCPSCRKTNLTFIDSSESIKSDNPGSEDIISEWEEYECQDCGASLMVENGYISVRRFDFAKFEYKTMMRYSINWEERLKELLND